MGKRQKTLPQEEDEEKEFRNPRNQDDPQNRLNLNEFHKHQPKHSAPKNRKQSTKKKIRDIERLLERPNLPAELILAKKNELRSLGKAVKNVKDAHRMESKYKKIKFIEKRKVIRKLEQLDSDDDEKKEWKQKLQYIDNHPANWKYISLFATTGDKDKDSEAAHLRNLNM